MRASDTYCPTNTCSHQSLPMMDTLPLRLMVDPNVVPLAHHTPVPVPVHWQEEEKAGIDRDIKLGVIEPVPIGEPVTWCHRMVICAKKNGLPRLTVDFQALNAMHLGRLTTLLPPSTKLNLCQATKGSLYLIARMAIIAFLSMTMINILQPLFHLGGTSAIKLHHKDT